MSSIPPISQHTVFIRGFPPSISADKVREYFVDEIGKCAIDFAKTSQDQRQQFIALRFDEKDQAKDMIERFNNIEVMGYRLQMQFYRDFRSGRQDGRQVFMRSPPGGYNNGSGGGRFGSRGGVRTGGNMERFGPRRGYDPQAWKLRQRSARDGRRSSRSGSPNSRSRSRSLSQSPRSASPRAPRQLVPSYSTEERRRSGSPSYRDSIERQVAGKWRRAGSSDRDAENHSDHDADVRRALEERRHSGSNRTSSVSKTEAASALPPPEDIPLPPPAPAAASDSLRHSPPKKRSSKQHDDGLWDDDFTNKTDLGSKKIKPSITVSLKNAAFDSPGREVRATTATTTVVAPLSAPIDPSGAAVGGFERRSPPPRRKTRKRSRDSRSSLSPSSEKASEISKHKKAAAAATANHLSAHTMPMTAMEVDAEPAVQSTKEKRMSSKRRIATEAAASFNGAGLSGSKEKKEKKVEKEVKKGKETMKLSDAARAAATGLSSDRQAKISSLPMEKVSRLQQKRTEIEKAYKQDCETFSTVVKMLLSKNPSLEDALLTALRESLKDVGQKFMNDLNVFVDELLDGNSSPDKAK